MKEKALQAWAWLHATVGTPALIIAGLFIVYLGYSAVQNWRLERELANQSERFTEFTEQSRTNEKKTEEILARFEHSHESTLKILGVIQEMSAGIDNLASADRQITIRLGGLEKNYEKARVGKSSNSGSLPLNDRESRALATDRELYPER